MIFRDHIIHSLPRFGGTQIHYHVILLPYNSMQHQVKAMQYHVVLSQKVPGVSFEGG